MIRPIVAGLALVLALGATPAMAQETDHAAIAQQKEAMKRLAWMFGTWRGPGKGGTREGPYTVTQTERIGPILDGTVVVMEGKGFRPDGSVGFNAFAVVSYDPVRKVYSMRSHALGHSGDFALTPTDNGYVWEIPAGPNAVIRYTATLADGTWTEVGDYVAAGGQPRRVFEMNLKRVGDTDWPAAGGLAPK